MSNHTVGTCSICGGPVQVPFAWHGLIPPIPKCAHCGAEAKAAYGPTIQMEPAKGRACSCRLGADECTGDTGVFHPFQAGASCATHPCAKQRGGGTE